MDAFYSYKVQTSLGEELQMSTYEGKVVLLVNIASKCGFTPQLKELEALYQLYKESGLVILGFPCNQFLNQSPEDSHEMVSFCELNYGVSFPIFQKIEVNGGNAHPLYQYLKAQKSQLGIRKVKWNFEKFLVDREGKVVGRFSSLKKPKELEAILKEYL